MSSRANRQTYAAMCSVYLLMDTLKSLEELTEPERVLCEMIQAHVNSDAAAPIAFEVTPKEVEKLNAAAIDLTQRMGTTYTVATLLNIWLIWAEDRLQATRHEGKRAFYFELQSLLDSLYMLFDPDYECKEDAEAGLVAAKELERIVS